jgi:hypothetical protein
VNGTVVDEEIELNPESDAEVIVLERPCVVKLVDKTGV